MSLPHYFLDTQVLARETEEIFPLQLSAEDAKHARVARLGVGEQLAVVDAAQDYFVCTVADFSEKLPLVRISQKLDQARKGPRVSLFQGLAKGEKMELVFRHGTELGVYQFTPVSCARSIVKLDGKKAADRVARWNAITKSAAMQSGQPFVAQVTPLVTLKAARSALADYDAVLICWEEADCSLSLSAAVGGAVASAAKPLEDLSFALVVGPEGGLSAQEVDDLLAVGSHVRLVSLGSSILRTETAGIVAPALVLYECGQLGGTVPAEAAR